MMEHIFLVTEVHSPRWQKLSGEVHITESSEKLYNFMESKDSSAVTFWLSAEHKDIEGAASKLAERFYKFIVLYTKPEITKMLSLLSLGAKGYTSFAASTEVLERITAVVHQGGLWVPEQLLSNLTGLSQKTVNAGNALPESFAILSKRERQVCQKVLAGLTNQKIAEALFITERTVKEHLTNSFRKLGIKDRLQLVLKARQEDLDSNLSR